MFHCSGNCASADEAQAVSLPGAASEGDVEQDSAAIVVDEPLKAQAVSEGAQYQRRRHYRGLKL